MTRSRFPSQTPSVETIRPDPFTRDRELTSPRQVKSLADQSVNAEYQGAIGLYRATTGGQPRGDCPYQSRSRPMIPLAPNYRLSRCQTLYRTHPIDIRSLPGWVDFFTFFAQS
jgi:hypothetical protein